MKLDGLKNYYFSNEKFDINKQLLLNGFLITSYLRLLYYLFSFLCMSCHILYKNDLVKTYIPFRVLKITYAHHKLSI